MHTAVSTWSCRSLGLDMPEVSTVVPFNIKESKAGVTSPVGTPYTISSDIYTLQ